MQLQQTLDHSALEDEDLLKYLEGIQTDTIIALRDLLPSPALGDMDPPGSEHGTGVDDHDLQLQDKGL